MGRSMSSKVIKHVGVKKYLQDNFAGSVIYVCKNESSGKYGFREAAHCLRKAGFPDEQIAKRFHMFPSQLAKISGFTVKRALHRKTS